jgi:hypothetical protein
MKDQDIIQRLRANLQPKGTAPIVLLHPIHSVGIEMHVDFVQKCIDELEQMPNRVALGDHPTNLEKLAYQLLLDSAYIDPKHEAEREARLAEYHTFWLTSNSDRAIITT